MGVLIPGDPVVHLTQSTFFPVDPRSRERLVAGSLNHSQQIGVHIKIDRHVNADRLNFPSPAGICGQLNIRQTTNIATTQVPVNHALKHPALSGNREILVPGQRGSAVRLTETVMCRLSSSGEPHIVRRPSGG